MNLSQSPADIMLMTKEGKVIKDKIVIAYKSKDKVVAIGEDALKSDYSTDSKVTVETPCSLGHITDMNLAALYFKKKFKEVARLTFFGQKVCLVVMDDYSQVEVDALKETINECMNVSDIIVSNDYNVYGDYKGFLERSKADLLIHIGVDEPMTWVNEATKRLTDYAREHGIDITVEIK